MIVIAGLSSESSLTCATVLLYGRARVDCELVFELEGPDGLEAALARLQPNLLIIPCTWSHDHYSCPVALVTPEVGGPACSLPRADRYWLPEAFRVSHVLAVYQGERHSAPPPPTDLTSAWH